MYSMHSGGYQHPQGTTTYYTSYDSNRTAQNPSFVQSLYVERSSTKPLSQPQRHIAPYTGSKTTPLFQSTPQRRINPALKIHPDQVPRSPHYANNDKQTYAFRKNIRSEVDDSPIIDPSAFRYLNLNERKAPKKKTASDDIESGIDTRPIINLDAVAKLERRRQQQLEKYNRLRADDGPREGIDDRSIIDLDAFRYIEAKTSKKDKQGQNVTSGIDDSPIVNPDAFKYLDGKRKEKAVKQEINEPSIDTRPIINPDAFKYIEKPDIPPKRVVDSGIDSEPIVSPDAFRYLERNPPPARSNVQSGVDTTSMVDPSAFIYIEKRPPTRAPLAQSSIDYSPIVSPDAFKYIERKEIKRRVDDGPDIDERSYVNPQAFRYIDQHISKRNQAPSIPEIDTRSLILNRNPHAFNHLERKLTNKRPDMESGIDERSYVNLDAFKYIEGRARNSRNKSTPFYDTAIDTRSYVNPDAFKYIEGRSNSSKGKLMHSSFEPTIDTRSYVNTEAFRHLEGTSGQTRNDAYYDHDGIDERPFIPPAAFRHLEFTDQYSYPYDINFFTFGQTDV